MLTPFDESQPAGDDADPNVDVGSPESPTSIVHVPQVALERSQAAGNRAVARPTPPTLVVFEPLLPGEPGLDGEVAALGAVEPKATTHVHPDGGSLSGAAAQSERVREQLGEIRVDQLYPDDEETAAANAASRRIRTVVEWFAVAAVAVVLTLLAQRFVVESFEIPSGSMIPTLEVGDRVMVNKLSYRLHDIARGDAVVFDRPESFPKRTESEPDQLIKRVIGLAGDTLVTRDGVVYVNDKALDEPYLDDEMTTDRIEQAIVVPEGSLFVMGDNRTASEDSRAFGPIDADLVVGRAALRFCLCTNTDRFRRL